MIDRRLGASHTDAQRRLLSAATEAFAELGYGGTSTRDIAARAGRSTRAVYVHFESKEDLLFAISFLGHESALQQLQAAAESTSDPTNRVRTMVSTFSTWHMTNAQLGRVVQYEYQALSDEHRTVIANLRRQFTDVMMTAIDDGIDQGTFGAVDVRAAAHALLSLSIDLLRWFNPRRSTDNDTIAGQHAELAVRMLRS